MLYLLPCVEFKGGDADILNVIIACSEQHVPLRSGGQGDLGQKMGATSKFYRFVVQQWHML